MPSLAMTVTFCAKLAFSASNTRLDVLELLPEELLELLELLDELDELEELPVLPELVVAVK